MDRDQFAAELITVAIAIAAVIAVFAWFSS
jgi:hypothetical protein